MFIYLPQFMNTLFCVQFYFSCIINIWLSSIKKKRIRNQIMATYTDGKSESSCILVENV